MTLDDQAIGEVYTRLREEGRATPYYGTLMVIAGLLAAVAMLTNSIPVLIGAMVIAPALSPLALAALAAVLGRMSVAARALGVAIGGIALATVAAVLCTWMLDVAGIISAEESLVNRVLLEERVRPGWYSAIAAIAAGIAGMLAVLKNKSDTLVGTVAAVALVPAAAAGGIAMKAGDPERALGGLALLSLNVVLIFVMGVLVLLVLGRGRRSASDHHADGSAPSSPSGKPPHSD